MTDQSTKQTVLDELSWEPSINAAHIGVTARDGVVTMTGHVASYAEKYAAERAAERVSASKRSHRNWKSATPPAPTTATTMLPSAHCRPLRGTFSSLETK